MIIRGSASTHRLWYTRELYKLTWISCTSLKPISSSSLLHISEFAWRRYRTSHTFCTLISLLIVVFMFFYCDYFIAQLRATHHPPLVVLVMIISAASFHFRAAVAHTEQQRDEMWKSRHTEREIEFGLQNLFQIFHSAPEHHRLCVVCVKNQHQNQKLRWENVQATVDRNQCELLQISFSKCKTDFCANCAKLCTYLISMWDDKHSQSFFSADKCRKTFFPPSPPTLSSLAQTTKWIICRNMSARLKKSWATMMRILHSI